MDRCPHCKSPGPSRPVCGVCGRSADVPPGDDELIDGYEPTRMPPVSVITVPVPGLEQRVVSPPVDPEPVPGLERTEDVLGDVRVPADDDEDRPLVCARCGAAAAGAAFCDRCGFRLVPSGRVHPGDAPDLRCLSCGTPNRPGAPVCAACGQRMHA